MSRKILISGYYGFNNSGDEAILEAIVDGILEVDDTVEITVLSKNPVATANKFDVKSVGRFKIMDILRSIKESDVIVSGGGSLLQDITSTRSLWYYLSIIRLAQLYKKPVMVYANGIGPIDRPINRILTKRILLNVDEITLRDKRSYEYLKSLGVKTTNVRVTSDSVLSLERSSEDRIRNIFKEESIPTDKKLLGVSVREWKSSSSKFLKVLSNSINEQADKYDFNVVIIPMHHSEDIKISRKLHNNLKRSYFIERNYDVRDVIGIISCMDFMVSIRLHPLIYAAMSNVPMLGISYDPKVKGLLDNLNISNYIDIYDMDEEKFVKLFDEIWINREEIKKELAKVNESLRKKSLENLNVLFQLLKKTPG